MEMVRKQARKLLTWCICVTCMGYVIKREIRHWQQKREGRTWKESVFLSMNLLPNTYAFLLGIVNRRRSIFALRHKAIWYCG
jgi:hypothetical protein